MSTDRGTHGLLPSRRPSVRLCGLLVAGGLSILCLPAGLRAQDEEEDHEDRVEHLEKILEQVLEKGRNRRPSVLGDIDLRRAPAHDRKVVRVLRKTRVTLRFERTGLDEVLDTLRELSALTFVVSGKATRALEKQAKEGKQKPGISMSIRKLSLENVLNLLARRLRTYRFTVRDGVVLLVHDSEYRPRRYLRVYNVTDLVRPRRHFRAPRLGLSMPGE